MAQYKVPQDVEADDKLLGPFSFRQFVYLLIAAGCIALAAGLFQIFPALAIIPAPFALFFIVLALPLKKDQPMETYLAAIVSYYLKPRKRTWMAGQRESTITITAPKIVEDTRTRDITGEEATHRLSFLADIVDSEGRAIKGMGNQVNEDLVAEANTATDMFESGHFARLEGEIARDETKRHEEVMQEMREAIAKSEAMDKVEPEKKNEPVRKPEEPAQKPEEPARPVMAETVAKFDGNGPNFASEVVILPNAPETKETVEKSDTARRKLAEKVKTIKAKPSIIELASNTDFSVATIAKEANRIKGKDESEVFISLH